MPHTSNKAVVTGSVRFFALPYAIIVYPFVFAVLPLLWKIAKDQNHVTAADVVHGRYASRPLEFAVALTGVLATALARQLIGLETIIHALGLQGRVPLIAAFLILAFYNYSSSHRLRKDTMTNIIVIVARLRLHVAIRKIATTVPYAQGL